VQASDFRYFAQDAAERLRLAGYVRNLRDGRVEVYAIGFGNRLARFLAVLKKARTAQWCTVSRKIRRASILSMKTNSASTHDI